jgi:hypothetical protein
MKPVIIRNAAAITHSCARAKTTVAAAGTNTNGIPSLTITGNPQYYTIRNDYRNQEKKPDAVTSGKEEDRMKKL